MLSYQHEYHAGNHADVLKHCVLTLLIGALQRKPAPLRVIDTHAGSGVYDLDDERALHRREHEGGIARVLAQRARPPEIARYLEVVEAFNENGELRRYPGSPPIARALLRPQDHLELFELHPQAFAALATRFRRDRQAHVHRRDALEGLVAVVPPPERRGVVLVDPSYETRDDFVRVPDALGAAHRRWAIGVYAVWYPLIDKPAAAKLARALRALPLPRLFEVELEISPAASGLRGSGLVIANLPFGVDAELERLLPWLDRVLAGGAGTHRARWLAPQ
ncbi:MAG TPA: 23S rRNA (adenine(2030)-N(6))-methyltransferase RlmJ [Gammaproteobacteria bacterium]